MISTKIRYIDFWASEWLEGTAELDNSTRGLYITACALIYARGDPLGIGVDLLKAACLDHGHAFKRQFQRLLDTGKLTVNDGKITNKRCANELQNAGKRVANAQQNGAKGGRIKRLENPGVPSAPKLTINYQLSTIIDKEEIPSVSPRNRGTRWVGVVCAEWVAETEGIRIKAKLSPVDGEAQAALFADFWVAKAGQAGVKLDWHATWRNWIRNARGGNGHDNGRQRLSPAEGIYKGWDTLIRGIEGEDNRDLDWQPAVPLLDRGRA